MTQYYFINSDASSMNTMNSEFKALNTLFSSLKFPATAYKYSKFQKNKSKNDPPTQPAKKLFGFFCSFFAF